MLAALFLLAVVVPLQALAQLKDSSSPLPPGVPGQYGPALQARSGVIEGLLGLKKRQYYCEDSGYFPCVARGVCCQDGGHCCKSGTRSPCCDPGYNCYNIGCCKTSQTSCGTGCMPKSGECCSDGRYCESGDYCVIVDGVHGCYPRTGGGGGGGGGGNDQTTTSYTSSFTTSYTTSYSTTIRPAPTRVPTGTAVDITGPECKWEGTWELTTSPCDVSKQGKSCSGSGTPSSTYSMTYTFSGAASIELSLDASDNLKYTITAGDRTVEYIGPEQNSSQAGVNTDCWFTYSGSQALVAGAQTWELKVVVEGPTSTDQLSAWWLQVNQLNVIMASGSSGSPTTSSSRTTASGLTATGSSSSSGNGAVANGFSVWGAIVAGFTLWFM